MGAADVIRFDRRGWRGVDLVPTADVCRVRPFVCGNLLLIPALHGEYVGSMSTYVNDERALPPGTTTALHVFDGEKTTRVPLEFDALRDGILRDGTLRLLILARGQWWIVETEDLKTFRWLALPMDRFTPLSLEFADGVYWIGTLGGNLFRSTGTRELPSLDAVADHGPTRLHAGGDLPGNARAGWLAVTRLSRPWVEAAVNGTLDGGTASVTTTDVDAFRLFPPRASLGEGGALALEIDGTAAFEGKVPAGRSLLCSRKDGRWSVEVVEGTAKGYEPEPQVLAACRGPLSPEALARWATGAILEAERGDHVLLPISTFKRSLPDGPVTTRAFVDLVHRNRIARLELTGKQLETMMAFNATKAEPRRRVAPHVGGPLEPEKVYRVLASDYAVSRAEQHFGRKLDAEITDRTVHEILVRWLAEHGSIGPETK
jgi:hypothetical protein